MEREGAAILDEERAARSERSDWRFVAPARVPRRRRARPVARPHRLKQFDRPPRRAGDQELEELGMGPDQRHRAAGGPAREEQASGNWRRVPHLFGQHAAGAGAAHHRAEVLDRVLAGLEREVAALSGEQRPQARPTPLPS